ncbi:hypothetical protein [Allohahella sp. A8]|uniref:hypothetical protein n=1 Tax=Allohahella sp. A8 TaxID=3141461 RepID=UPI003A800CBA
MKFLLEQTELEGDLEYSVILVPCGSQPGFYPELHADTVYVPERVFWRIFGIGNAYNLQFSYHVSRNRSDRWVCRGDMLPWVIEELSFIHSLVNDDVLKVYVASVIDLLRKAALRPDELEVGFEGP